MGDDASQMELSKVRGFHFFKIFVYHLVLGTANTTVDSSEYDWDLCLVINFI